MRGEILLWWKQALKDFESAKKNFEIEEWNVVAFLCQQSVEKALKALYIQEKKKSPGTTHSLVYLGKELSMSEEMLRLLRKLAPDFILTRYPDASQTLPYELYDKYSAEERLEIAEKVLKWVSERLKIE